MLAGCGERFGLDRRTAFRLARGFGSGMGTGNLCGAVTGAFMVLGFVAGEDADERRARFRTYDLVAEFSRRFEARRGSLLCKTLLGGVDVGTEAGRQEARERNLFREVCPAFVHDAVEVLDELRQGGAGGAAPR
ncbi:MAG: C-GCAxxG-C-C family protein [Candidatus Methylomirabilales bacterium]